MNRKPVRIKTTHAVLIEMWNKLISPPLTGHPVEESSREAQALRKSMLKHGRNAILVVDGQEYPCNGR